MNQLIANMVQTIMSAALAAVSEAWAVGKIEAVVSNGARDGNALVTVSWRGTSIKASYASSYTPAVGHVVLMARPPDQLVIVCRIIGTP